jgi:hypothetical protein
MVWIRPLVKHIHQVLTGKWPSRSSQCAILHASLKQSEIGIVAGFDRPACPNQIGLPLNKSRELFRHLWPGDVTMAS